MGTIGGSLAHADPASDYPAAVIALGAELVAQGPKGKRTIKVDDFFKGLMTTAVQPDEILVEIRFPALPANTGMAYMKFPHPASRFAVVGVAAAVTVDGKGACSKAGVGVTGAGTKAIRARGVEAALVGETLDASTIQAAAAKAADGVDVQADLQGSVEYKTHLIKVYCRRALEAAVKASGGFVLDKDTLGTGRLGCGLEHYISKPRSASDRRRCPGCRPLTPDGPDEAPPGLGRGAGDSAGSGAGIVRGRG
jgi:carbon-monoxide dehydrogenase medium subunit